MPNNNRAINRVFTRNVINDLLQNGSSDVLDYVVARYVDNPKNKTHGQLFSEIYAHLGKEKRNEYFYLNTLLNRILVGYHSVNTTTALSQMRIGRHIADFVMINGEGVVYEVKSNLDNLDRLSDQLRDYFKAFSKVVVLSAPHEYEKISHRLETLGDMGAAVGIYIMNQDDIYFNENYRREAKAFDESLEHNCIFKLLRKSEYENTLKSFYGDIPEVAPVFHFRACFEQFEKIPILQAQKLALTELKKRNKITKMVFDNIQPELKSIVYFSDLTRKLPEIENLLALNYKG
ncbi:MAG: sce7726 family protein [Oscillospiraceae bacterium]|nr:sce7726 family protein [Oscillospiraceae bacterium]